MRNKNKILYELAQFANTENDPVLLFRDASKLIDIYYGTIRAIAGMWPKYSADEMRNMPDIPQAHYTTTTLCRETLGILKSESFIDGINRINEE